MFDESVTEDGSELSLIGLTSDGQKISHLVRNGISPAQTYRMVYQVEKNRQILPKKVDMSFGGEELVINFLNTKIQLEAFYPESGSKLPFPMFHRHQLKESVIVYCYTKIFGASPQTQKLIKNVTGIPSKSQKWILRNKSFIRSHLAAYLYIKIEEGFDSVLINDVFAMTEDEIEKWVVDVTEINSNLFKDQEELKESLRNGYLNFHSFNTSQTDQAHVRTSH